MKNLPFNKTPISLALTGLLFTGFTQAASTDWGPWGGGGYNGDGDGQFGGDGNGGDGDHSDTLLFQNQQNFNNQFGGGAAPTSLADMAFLEEGNFFGTYDGISDSGSHDIFMWVYFGEGQWNGNFQDNTETSFSFSAFGDINGNNFSTDGLEGCSECSGGVSGTFFGSQAASAGGSFNVNNGSQTAADTFNIPQTSLEGGGGGFE